MEGGFFDNIWNPYAHYPRPQYYRPVYDQYSEEPLNQKTVKTVKTVKTIPVTDGSAHRFKSKDAAATKLQAVYRGYVVRKTQPLQHLRVIKKVNEELESLKVKLLETEQKKKLTGDAKERLRWTEGVMALLLRLDSLQGVHSEVRLVRKAVTKELLGFQETIDSMSNELDDVIIRSENTGVSALEGMEIEGGAAEELSGDFASGGVVEDQGSDGHKDIKSIGDSAHVPNAHSAIDDRVLDSVALHCDDKNGSLSGLVGEAAVVVSEPSSPEAPMAVENKEQLSMISPAHDMDEGEVEPASQIMYQVLAPGGAIKDGCDGQGIKVIEDSTSEKHLPHANSARYDRVIDLVAPHCDDQNRLLVGETTVEEGFVSEPSSSEALVEAPTGLEGKKQILMMSPAHLVEEDGVETTSSLILLPEIDNPEADTSVVAGEVRREEEAELDMSLSGANGVFARLEEKETTGAGGDGSIIPASNSVQSLCDQSLQGDNMNALSDRALLLQVLEENRKLKDVIGKVLQWGKQQGDVIHDLTHRIAQLEEHQPPSKLFHGEDNNGKKRNLSPVENRARSRRRLQKDRRNRCRLGYVDSEDWLSAESDEYF